MLNSDIYTTGGTVQAGGGVYIHRQADDDLLNLCRSRTFAYVLTPRQMGKSSLMVQTANTLEEEGVRTVIIDLTEIGTQVTREEWYLGILTLVEDQLDLDTNVLDWWEKHVHLGFTQRLTRFFKEVVLFEVEEPIVVFVDEIDTTLSLNFTDDFFVAVRYFYMARAQNPDFMRLSFVLFGVASPGDLIRDRTRTPFNIGKRIDLDDFTLSEALPLARGLSNDPEKSQKILRIIFKWTCGHPYLTQRACQEISQQEYSLNQNSIRDVIKSIFHVSGSKMDNNLQFVRDMLLERSPNKNKILSLYGKIRKGRTVLDEEKSLEKSHLKLSGIVKRDGEKLLLRNKVYKENFDQKWIRENIDLETYVAPPRQAFLASSLGTFAIVFILKTLGFWEPRELYTYDQYHHFLPNLPPDQRITIVGLSEADIQQYGWPLSDQTLTRLLQRLQGYEPKVIGLNLYYNHSPQPDRSELVNQLNAENLITIMNVGNDRDLGEVPPPPQVPWERIGFNDLVIDPDGVLRRSLLFVRSSENPYYSFALRVTLAYLSNLSSTFEYDQNSLTIGNTKLHRLGRGTGGYQTADNRGYQILLRYRARQTPAQQLTVSQVLNGRFKPEWIRGKVVLVGTTAPSLKDQFYTPYSANQGDQFTMSGVVIHAQMISQLLDIVEGKDAKFYFLPTWLETFLMAGFALFGAFLPWKIHRPAYLVGSAILVICSLYGVSFIFLTDLNVWMPIIEPVSAFILSIVFIGSTFYYYSFSRERH